MAARRPPHNWGLPSPPPAPRRGDAELAASLQFESEEEEQIARAAAASFEEMYGLDAQLAAGLDWEERTGAGAAGPGPGSSGAAAAAGAGRGTTVGRGWPPPVRAAGLPSRPGGGGADPWPAGATPRRPPPLARDAPLEQLVRRLSRLLAASARPLVPAAIGSRARVAPSEADAALSPDHARLLARLREAGLAERRIAGDGNCQFASISDQLYRTPSHAGFVREVVCAELAAHRGRYEGFLPDGFDVYLERMKRPGEWGDNVTLQAASNAYGLEITVLTSFEGDVGALSVQPAVPRSSRSIYLSFFAEVHYQSIYPAAEMPP